MSLSYTTSSPKIWYALIDITSQIILHNSSLLHRLQTAESRLKVTDAKLQDIVDRIEREVVKVDAPLHKSSSLVDGIAKASPMKNIAQR